MKSNIGLSHNFLLCTVVAVTAAIKAPVGAAPVPSDIIKAQGGVIRITPKFHGSFQIAYAGKIFEIDPVSAASYAKKADYILITHAHPDHFDMAAIKKLAKDGTQFIAPPPIVQQLQKTIKSGAFAPLANKDTDNYSSRLDLRLMAKNMRDAVVRFDAVPMYNVVRERAKGQKFHPNGDINGNGYILTLGGKRIYIAGDTEATPEMRQLKNIDIAFIPMNLPFTMTSQEAAKGARAFKPKIVYPYHYRYPFNKANNNPQQFAAALKGSGIQVRIRNWYPSAAVARATAAAKK